MNKMQKLSILSLSFISLIATAAMAPALNGIQSHFINAPETLIKLVVTLPALICIPIGLLNKAFMKFISKKNLIIIGLLLYTIGGLSSSLSPNIYVLLFTKVILGLGLGVTAPLSLVLIGDFFHGKERAKFMGFATATTNLGGIISTLFVGFLVSLGWRYSFLVYAVAIIVLFLIVFFLPNDYENNEEKLSTGNLEEDIKLNKGIFKYAILVFLGLIAFYAIPTNMDFLVKLRNLGGASTAANIVSIGTLTSLISAMIFPKLIKIFKRYFSLIIFISMFLGFIILGTSHSMPMILIGAIFVGFGFGDVIPFGMLFASNLVHKTHTALAILIVTTGLYFGEFVSPLILQFLSKTLNIQNVTGSLFGACIVCIVALLVSIYAIISDRKLVI
ncbi:MFS transporter [Clostridium thermobutyricum]|uniref:MFS transporter n=1 Tax=Clostridium thermobutyricum TaxID=29372 RepID=UPI0018AA783E|nr:MFS transporter [Clostridium thermobutyricum]